jgi:hypothetical membrane protein
MLPTKSPTPAEYRVLLFSMAVFFILLGAAFLFVGISRDTIDPEKAKTLRHSGMGLLFIGILAVCAVKSILRKLAD